MKQPLDTKEIDRIIEMAWEDRTPFDAIKRQFGLKEQEVKALMKSTMKPSSYVMWRDRVNTRKTKHSQLVGVQYLRFKSKNQK
ncbi:MAG: TIGR03643 family protein [Candidatus Kapabacteria bacterium]|nr:TIGR03643 family protein [Candidatus Kapabacteria bacterium]